MFDFNVHLPCDLKLNTVGRLIEEGSMTISDLQMCYGSHRQMLRESLDGANFMLFNQDLPFDGYALSSWTEEVRKDWKAAAFTQLLDFRRDGLSEALDRLVEAGVYGVKFHSYVQRIEKHDFCAVIESAKLAAARGMFICVDASYGTTYLYERDNLRLAALLARAITAVPVVILHSGGARCLEAMLIALDCPNVYLETSFSLPFYKGSSVEADFAFAYRKVGVDKILYASDFPYVTVVESLRCIDEFFNKFKFSEAERSAILGDNALGFLAALPKSLDRCGVRKE